VTRDTEHADVAVVIDVLRATSVIATALAAGASQIVTCREISEAIALAGRITPRPLLCGERGCKPIDGFDLGNSPAEYTSQRVQGQSLILTTTNGTRAIEAVADTRRVVTASFLNLSAVIETFQQSENVHLVCAGTDGEITAEDVLLAGAIVSECETRYQAVVQDDESILARQLWQSWFSRESLSAGGLPECRHLSGRLRETRGGSNLLRLGYQQDLDRCAAIDSLRVVPELKARQPVSFGLQAG
jgi:2-phosphosulfolactate phosphatase